MNVKTSLAILILVFSFSQAFASMPVEVTITGCVRGGVFVSSETDYGTHKVKKDYKIRVMDRETKAPLDMKPYNNKKITIKGYLLPGDSFFVDKNKIKKIGTCGESGKLGIEEQEWLAKDLFTQMSKADTYDADLFIRLYTRVINECADTERAQESYWRLSNLYLQAFDQPNYEKIVSLLEEAIKKHPDTPATPHYKHRLLLAYEKTKQWWKGDKEKAIKILNNVVGFGETIEDCLLDIAKEKIKDLQVR